MSLTASLPAPILALPARTPELAALLESWSLINSGSGHLAGLERMRNALRSEFTRAFPAALVEEPALVGTTARALRLRLRPSAPRQILLNGHYDTVYEATDPFQACTRPDADTLRGPGVADMKGGIVVLLAALQAFEQTPGTSALGWEILLTPDEETGSHGSAPLFVEAAARHTFALVFEPARPSGDIVQSRKGTGSFIATCRGRAAHAAQVPSPGRNAILALAEFLLAAAKIPAELPGVLVNVGNIRGGSAATNVVPDFAQSELDVRITRVADREPLLARLHALAGVINARDGFRLELAGSFNRPPKECGPAEEAVFAAWQQVARDLGQVPPSWVHSGGGSDGNLLFAAGLANLDAVGPLGDHLHSDRECVVLSSIATRAQIVALFLTRYAAGSVSLPW
jgi:glutamate carboxypeptidase